MLKKNCVFTIAFVMMTILGFGTAICHAQTEWTKYSENPVLDLGADGEWDDTHVADPSVILNNDVYQMWYEGHDGSNWRIGYATSDDGITWTKHHNNPVLDLGADGEWDDQSAGDPTVLFDNGIYKMWYKGNDGATWRIGYATSDDGINWTKHPSNPILNLGDDGEWDDTHVGDPCVLLDNNVYRMWYRGNDVSNTRIGYATSDDGINWTKYPNNPVLDLGSDGAWDDANHEKPSVLLDNEVYKIWYSGSDGTNWRIGYAVSLDGISWTKYAQNPVVDLGADGEWDDLHVYGRSILLDNGLYKMWYSGHDGANLRIGYATSTPPPEPHTDHILVLEGPGNSVEIPDSESLAITDEITIEGWFRLLSVPSAEHQTAIRKEGAYALEPQNPIEGNGDSFGLALWFFGNDIRVEAATPVNVGEWTHVAGTYDGSQMKIYINGQLEATRDIGQKIDTSNEPLIFGRCDLYDEIYDGEMDGIRIWNVERTQAEIQDAMNRRLTDQEIASGTVVGNWHFDYGNAEDLSLFCNHGTLIGSAEIMPKITSGNYALSLDGVDDLVDIEGAFLNNQSNWTVSAWINLLSGGMIYSYIYSEGNPNVNFHILVTLNGSIHVGAWNINRPDSGWVSYSTPINVISFGEWNFIAVTLENGGVDTGNLNVYVNENSFSGTLQQAYHPDSQYAVIGRNVGSTHGGVQPDNPFNGLIDEVRIWNITRTEEQIQSAMNRTLTQAEINSGDLVGYWNFDNGRASDFSLNANHGTLVEDARVIPLGDWQPSATDCDVGDVSGNGTISAYDASLILQYVVGLIDEFPESSLKSPNSGVQRDYVISLPQISAKAGDRVQIPIFVEDATGLTAGGIAMKYDGDLLKAVDFAPTSLLNGFYWKANINQVGEVRFAFASTEPAVGKGELLRLEFEVLSNNTEGQTSPLLFDNVQFADSLSIKAYNGAVMICPSQTALLPNYPNPFNPETWFPYLLSEPTQVVVRIYALDGRMVRLIDLDVKEPGVYVDKGKAIYWDGRNDIGERVSSGIYFYQMQAGKFNASRKMIVVR